jgi:hypothetical protein
LLSGVLFAIAAWLKPNVVGLAAGSLVYEMRVGKVRALRPLIGALAVSAGLAFWSNRLSGGLWLQHLAKSTMQPIDPLRALQLTISRFPFLGAPHLFAAYCGWRGRNSPHVRLVLSALTASLLWTMVSIGKVGSSTNYWMEPTIAAVMVFVWAPVPRFRWLESAAVQIGALLLVLVLLAVNTTGSLVGIDTAIKRRHALDRVRAECGAAPTDLVMAEHPGYEVMLNGRLLETPYQMTHLARSGRYPIELWKADIRAPEIRCLVMESDLLERPLGEVNVADDRFGVEIRAALASRFQRVAQDSGLWVYRARPAASSD